MPTWTQFISLNFYVQDPFSVENAKLKGGKSNVKPCRSRTALNSNCRFVSKKQQNKFGPLAVKSLSYIQSLMTGWLLSILYVCTCIYFTGYTATLCKISLSPAFSDLWVMKYITHFAVSLNRIITVENICCQTFQGNGNPKQNVQKDKLKRKEKNSTKANSKSNTHKNFDKTLLKQLNSTPCLTGYLLTMKKNWIG